MLDINWVWTGALEVGICCFSFSVWLHSSPQEANLQWHFLAPLFLIIPYRLQTLAKWRSVCVCVCVCVWERERERECVCVKHRGFYLLFPLYSFLISAPTGYLSRSDFIYWFHTINSRQAFCSTLNSTRGEQHCGGADFLSVYVNAGLLGFKEK